MCITHILITATNLPKYYRKFIIIALDKGKIIFNFQTLFQKIKHIPDHKINIKYPKKELL